MKASHRLVGYDRRTELEKFELPIPERMFGEVRTVVTLDDDDPNAAGCYELTNDQARLIATMAHRGQIPTGLDFFLEAYAA
ncbi:DUF7683 domain-containing protein [Bradyrhizobium sp. AZCC 2230]|uniref:DUF7683 domain-containing protein n=1 Tax=Bradyrhizobium sp. AZCC 2230 TaxID=3117021 RepID=UPI002FF1B1E7